MELGCRFFGTRACLSNMGIVSSIRSRAYQGWVQAGYRVNELLYLKRDVRGRWLFGWKTCDRLLGIAQFEYHRV
ncbi:hypothetical protein CY34DRAFT_801221 [Suillus luteus UH-Slu-Lm8-n1]|uniref:Uncharacterized protein n=1 Tax=Suillus luteus UH-Slu-Lm8-n1 TaxID=930992 RepID=A0A0D0BRU0_9AGAM|nr:hypothetical protein CY34DRAFT_801221 [Suillus luteus UH-Slu-Lm8-n1]